jgi:hypothetical protein
VRTHRDQFPMRHKRAQTPAHLVWVEHRPSSSGTRKTTYYAAVKAAATTEIGSPITGNDIEIEVVYSTTRKAATRLEADNLCSEGRGLTRGLLTIPPSSDIRLEPCSTFLRSE